MNKQICISLVVLPVYLHNPASKMISNGLLLSTRLILPLSITHVHFSPKVIFARDDQTEDCLRTGGCKN